MNTPTTPQVPDKLSDLIQLALDDIDKCQKDERYVIDMHVWHVPDGGKCCVCLAGAVMAQTHKTPIDKYRVTVDDKAWDKAFNALDFARMGYLESAYMALFDKELPSNVPGASPYYPSDWRLNAEWCRDELRKVGL